MDTFIETLPKIPNLLIDFPTDISFLPSITNIGMVNSLMVPLVVPAPVGAMAVPPVVAAPVMNGFGMAPGGLSGF